MMGADSFWITDQPLTRLVAWSDDRRQPKMGESGIFRQQGTALLLHYERQYHCANVQGQTWMTKTGLLGQELPSGKPLGEIWYVALGGSLFDMRCEELPGGLDKSVVKVYRGHMMGGLAG
jgi:hypothetical protein